MKLIFRIAFRNLIRQKRRNLLLGTGIAFGIMILFISQSYTKGLSDILINSFISSVFGHIQVNATEKSDRSIAIIRDKDAVLETIHQTLDDVNYCWESVSTLTRTIGNGSGALMLVVGIEKHNGDFLRSLNVAEGDIRDFTEERTDTPIILYAPKAEELNVKTGETVNMKLTTIYGQVQSTRATVAAIVKPENIFMTMAGFIPLDTLKSLLGYRPHETSRINIVLNHIRKPEETVAQADRLHRAFKPKPVFFNLTLTGRHGQTQALAGGLQTQPEITPLFLEEFNLPTDMADTFSADAMSVIIGKGIADTLQEEVNGTLTLSYHTKFDGPHAPDAVFTIRGVIDEPSGAYADVAFFNVSGFYPIYSEDLPRVISGNDQVNDLTTRDPLRMALAYDKMLLKRPADSREWKKLLRQINKHRGPGTLMHITSMNETAEDVLKIESALNLICIITVIILFMIILTGTVNALRMTLRERTREIGTIRSIGMQKKHVVRLFVIESGLLALFASAAGTAGALLLMFLLTKISFQVDNLFSLLIDNGHLHFLPDLTTGLVNIILTVAVTVFTIWFPVKKAVGTSITGALSCYE
ncbi:ABC transporter permease [Desulfoluna sp.]|uniref:ABC transporter permease n=1 Tax=Desulfoluna sp. TaxID=2045199 RepID=UPI0026348BFD|nr:ABC transporter permease [Desulfoluna sp.]